MTDDTLLFFHSPRTRSSATAVLLEELGAPHERRILNMRAGEQRQPAFLAINPLGKVPAILHRGELVTEQVAITIYLADLFPAAGLAPAFNEGGRGSYLRWLVFYGSCFEPAMVDHAMKREPAPVGMSPYGSFEGVIEALTSRLKASPFLAGDRFTAADVLWGLALRYMTGFGLMPESPEVTAYIGRIAARPAVAKVDREDAALLAEHEAAVSNA